MMHPITVVVLLCSMSVHGVFGFIESRQYPTKLAKCFNKIYYKSYTVNHQVGLSMLHKCISEYKWTSSSSVIHPGKNVSSMAINYVNRLVRKTITQQQMGSGGRVGLRRGKRQTQRHRPPNNIRVRKEYRMLTDQERVRFHRALRALKRPDRNGFSRYDLLSSFHSGEVSTTAHAGCNFPGWHRVYIRAFEDALREIDPTVTLPYWDSTLDQYMENSVQSVMFSRDFVGNGEGEVTTGPFANWQTGTSGPLIRSIGASGELMTHAEITNITSRTRMNQICSGSDPLIYHGLEFHHGDPHVWMGGQMGNLETAAEDPVFFMHHCFVDLIYEKFRENSRAAGIDVENDYPTTDFGDDGHGPNDRIGLLTELSVRHGILNFWMDDVRYDERPTCSARKRDCGSNKLRCVQINSRYMCISKTLQEYERDLAEERNMNTGIRLSASDNNGRTFSMNVNSIFSRPLRFFQESEQCPANLLDNRPVQNTFCSNDKRDINQWVYVPVRIMSLRAPKFKRYDSYPVRGGSLSKERDIYSTDGFADLTPGDPRSYTKCKSDKTGAGQIFVRSDGINYDGTYQEYAIVDQRLSVSISIAYVAVKNPRSKSSEALVSAYDSCGRVCIPSCLDYNTNKYKPCSGVINVSTRSPKMYGEKFGESVMDVYDFTPPKHCPQFKMEKVYLSFFCDYSNQWPWHSAVGQLGARPKGTLLNALAKRFPIIGNLPILGKRPLQGNRIGSGKQNKKKRGLRRCDLGSQCIIKKYGKCKAPCKENTFYQCEGQCRRYAECKHGMYHVKSCFFGHFDINTKSCRSGFGNCNQQTTGYV